MVGGRALVCVVQDADQQLRVVNTMMMLLMLMMAIGVMMQMILQMVVRFMMTMKS